MPPASPVIPTTFAEAQSLARAFAADPWPLARPVIVLAGWRAPRLRSGGVGARLRALTSNDANDFLSIAYPHAGSIGAAEAFALARIAEQFRDFTSREFDVVAISMGGLVARSIAAAGHLRIKRLFTIATPHRGAKLARLFPLDLAARDMRAGSAFLRDLDAALPHATYELTCYAQTRDWWVGEENTAPLGHAARTVTPETIYGRLLSHFAINSDPRVLVDIALHLRTSSTGVRDSAPPTAP